MYVNGDNLKYFDSFGIKHIQHIITNTFRIQGYNSVMCRYFCIGFIDLMLKGKSLLDYWNLFSPNKYGKNDKIFQ